MAGLDLKNYCSMRGVWGCARCDPTRAVALSARTRIEFRGGGEIPDNFERASEFEKDERAREKQAEVERDAAERVFQSPSHSG